MPNRQNDERALPGGVFVPEDTMIKIARAMAKLSRDERASQEVVLFRSGRYRVNTDQVITYNHESNLPRQYPKADLVRKEVTRVSQVPKEVRMRVGSGVDDRSFLKFLRKNWDETLELDSPITVIVCRNLKGALIDYYEDSFTFFGSGPSLKE